MLHKQAPKGVSSICLVHSEGLSKMHCQLFQLKHSTWHDKPKAPSKQPNETNHMKVYVTLHNREEQLALSQYGKANMELSLIIVCTKAGCVQRGSAN